MNKTEYMGALRQALEGQSAAQIEETMWAYEARFNEGRAAGKSEEEIAAGLPKPELLAAQKKASNRYQALKTSFTLGNIASLIVALIGLMFFNLFLLIPAIVYFSLLCSSYIIALSLYVAGIGITAASLSGVENFNFDLPAGYHHVHKNGHYAVNGKNHRENVRVDVTESGILIDGEPVDKTGVDVNTSGSSNLPVSVSMEKTDEKLHVEVGNHFYGAKIMTGIGILLGSIVMLMFSMFMTKYTFIGARHYLRWNLSQLHLAPRPA
ncbi:DUF1700 domain-containing protein [Undibacterium sp. TJN19]|uniref:DUF1700 domain-containing protein n=1 Tax=Undibacterium sp. TJN19 TaxID=3413055 RepID=UPI003BEF9613